MLCVCVFVGMCVRLCGCLCVCVWGGDSVIVGVCELCGGVWVCVGVLVGVCVGCGCVCGCVCLSVPLHKQIGFSLDEFS